MTPKGFTETEKTRLRACLLEKGRELFERYGLRKTSVEDLTRAAGISKGAFYLFFDSKEALFFEVLVQAQAAQQASFLNFPIQRRRTGRQNFKALVQQAFAQWENDTFLRQVGQENYALLLRKLPPGQMQAYLQSDTELASNLIKKWGEAGIHFTCSAEKIAGLLLALFFVSLHKDDLGPTTYPPTMNTLIDLVTEYLVEE